MGLGVVWVTALVFKLGNELVDTRVGSLLLSSVFQLKLRRKLGLYSLSSNRGILRLQVLHIVCKVLPQLLILLLKSSK